MRSGSLIATLTATLALGGCGVLGGGSGNSDASEATPLSELEVGTEAAPRGYEQLGRYSGDVRTRCVTAGDREEAFERALERMREQASADGATYLRVLGTGSLEDRGVCDDDVFRITGLGFRAGGDAPAPTASGDRTGEEGNDAATRSGDGEQAGPSLTERLEEIETLRERGLIDAEEYEALRERVLERAY